MTDPRATRWLPRRWLLPPAPRDAELARRFARRSLQQRRDLTRRGPEDLRGLDAEELELVAALAEARLATSWRLLLGAAGLGWLVLMTVWGFGRSTYPQDASVWFAAGVVLGLLTWSVAAGGARRRRRRAREVRAAARAR